MNDIVEFKRMNFFKGWFTTAQDWNDGQRYHLEKRRLHNRVMHTPGIARDAEGNEELNVTAKGGTELEIGTGVALDGNGQEISVGQPQTLVVDLSKYADDSWLYIAIQPTERNTDYIEYEDQPYTGFTRVAEEFEIAVRTSVPRNDPWVELARLQKMPGMTAITNDDIDRDHVQWAGAVGVELPKLPPAIKTLFTTVMEHKRQSYANLGGRIPVPSADDVSNIAFTVWILVITNNLSPDGALAVLAALAEVEGDVLGEIATTYPNVTALPGYSEYQDAVQALQDSVAVAAPIEQLLDKDDEVSKEIDDFLTLNDLQPGAEPVVEQPEPTTEEEAAVLLDASGSGVALGAAFYHWERKSFTPPG